MPQLGNFSLSADEAAPTKRGRILISGVTPDADRGSATAMLGHAIGREGETRLWFARLVNAILPKMPTFLVVHGSLTDGAETVLVNASNTNCELGSGVSGAIRRACGLGYQEHIMAALHARCGSAMPPGEVLITDAGSHPHAHYVAHVAVMDYRHGFGAASFPSLALVRQACTRLWQELEGLGTTTPLSVAMVALGGGTGRLGVRQPTEVACQTLAEHLSRHQSTALGRLVFYGYELPEYLAMVEVVGAHFPLEPGSVPPEVQDYLKRL